MYKAEPTRGNPEAPPIKMQGASEIRRAIDRDAGGVARLLEQARGQTADSSHTLLSFERDNPSACHRIEELKDNIEKVDEAYFVGGPRDEHPTVVLRCHLLEGAPKVYNPGRSLLVLREFCGEGDSIGVMGSQLVDEAVRWAKGQSKGGALLVVSVTWQHEKARNTVLSQYPKTSELRTDPSYRELFTIEGAPALMKPATTWYFRYSDELRAALQHGTSSDVGIRRAEDRDIEAMVQLSKMKRHDYARHQPVFWRPAEGGEKSQADFFSSLLQQPANDLFVSEGGNSELTGFIIAQAKCSLPMIDPALHLQNGLHVDDFVVARDTLWGLEGRALLAAALEAHQAYSGNKGVVNVISGVHDTEKRRLLSDICGMLPLYTWDILPSPSEALS